MTHFFKLIRWQNLLLIALAQVLIKYALLDPFKETYGVETALTPIGMVVLVLATLCIAAGGYIINDIQDVECPSLRSDRWSSVKKSELLNDHEDTQIRIEIGGVKGRSKLISCARANNVDKGARHLCRG